jgi:lipoprotein-anchoring transpeptidase ErfK/SrfK
MFRGFMPALTVVVFGIGLGIGISWSRGLIPLSLSPAKSGSLSYEVTQREPLPPPNQVEPRSTRQTQNSANDARTADPVVFEQQSEPDIDSSIAVTSKPTPTRSHVIPAVRETEMTASDSSESTPRDDAIAETESFTPPTRIRLRERSTPSLESRARDNAAVVRDRNKSVTVVAHQDPAESSNDASGAAKSESTSPREQLAQADAKLEEGEILAAHRLLSKLYWNHKELRSQIQEKIDNTAKSIFFQSQPQFVEPYVIQPGDRLEVVAKKYQLSWEYLAKLNRTDPRRIQSGQKLKVLKGPFGAVVELREFALTVHLQGYYVKRYPVCIGKDDSSPVGKFAVLNKVENPPYTGPDGKVIAADDSANPLGERWIDLGDSYGIHGTIDPDSIGKAESRGCIRMGDREIIEVYNFLVKGSEVAIRK